MDNQNTNTSQNDQTPPVTPPPVNQPLPQQPTYYQPAQQSTGTSDDTKTIVTILLLLFAYPIGFILMWVWTAWKTWVKLLVSLLSCGGCLFFMLIFMAPFFAAMFLAVNPKEQMNRANCAKQCTQSSSPSACITQCMEQYLNQPTQSPLEELTPTP